MVPDLLIFMGIMKNQCFFVNCFRIKSNPMRNLSLSLLLFLSLILVKCNKEDQSDRFKFLTGSTWVSDSLLVDGVDAGYSGGLLDDFKGELTFHTDGTGVFGSYSGTWELTYNDTEIILTTESLSFPIVTQVEELTKSSLKVTTGFPNSTNPGTYYKIRMTFKSK